MSKLIVTIMAAGEGKRMNSSIPKILHNFNSIPMLIRIIIESYKLLPNKIIVITGKYDKLIRQTVYEYFFDKNRDILNNIIFVKQHVSNGTGGAIKTTLNYYDDNDNVLILNGDMPLISYNLLEKFINANENNSDTDVCKLLVAKLDKPFGYGRILYKNSEFVGIKEEKECSDEEKNIDIVNVGIYYFNSKFLKKYIPNITNKNSQNEYYLTDIIKIMREFSDVTMETYLVEEELKYQIMGVNTQEELKKLEEYYELLQLI